MTRTNPGNRKSELVNYQYCCFVIALACASLPVRAAPKIDPQLVGTWELYVPYRGVWVIRFNADGSYECTNEGHNLPGHSGTFEAANGQWKTESKAGAPGMDGGVYQVLHSDAVVMTGKLGPGTWVRRPGGVQPAASSGTFSKIAPLVAKARDQTMSWVQDAELTDVMVTADINGVIDLANLKGIANQHGCFITLKFLSPSTRLVKRYVISSRGRAVEQGIEGPPDPETVSIPEPYLDLDQALAKAREIGLETPKSGFIEARLNGVKGIDGKPNSAIWRISAFDTSGPYPMTIGEPIELAAAKKQETRN